MSRWNKGHIFEAIFLVVSASTIAESSSAAELWKCEYVHYSLDKRPGSPPPLKIPAFYKADGDELNLLNGKARYKIVANTGFGLMAVLGEACDYCTGGPLIDTEVVSINKQNGKSSIDSFL